MNYKITLLFILSLGLCPNLQAMRRGFSLARLAMNNSQVQTRAMSSFLSQNAYDQQKEESHKTHQSSWSRYYLPTAIAIGLGLYQSQVSNIADKNDAKVQEQAPAKTAQQEAPLEISLDELDITDVKAVLMVLKNGTQADKITIAEKVARNITRYTTTNIINLLRATNGRPHRLLIMAVTKNIIHYTPSQIGKLLIHDTCDETHREIAYALCKNYTQFTSVSFWGYQLYSTTEWRNEYVAMLKNIKPEFHYILLPTILQHMHEHDVIDIVNNIDRRHKEEVLNAFQNSGTVNLNMYEKPEKIIQLLKLTHPSHQITVAHAIAQNIKQYNSFFILKFIKECTLESKEIIMASIVKNIDYYNCYELEELFNNASKEQQQIIANEFARTLDARMQYPVMLDFFLNYPPKEVVLHAIVKNIDHYDAATIETIIQGATPGTIDVMMKAGNVRQRTIIAHAAARKPKPFAYTVAKQQSIKSLQ